MITELSWTEFKRYIDGTLGSARFQAVETDDLHKLWFDREGQVFTTQLLKDPARFEGVNGPSAAADRNDYVNHWKTKANKAPPRTSDGKDIVLPSIFPGNVSLAHPGVGDAAGKWDGQEFRLECSSAESGDAPPLEWGFNDWVYIAGGHMLFSGAVFGDALTYEIFAPATTASPGTTYSKQDVGGGLHRFLPGGGTFDIDLTTDAVPVPSVGADGRGTGHFDWTAETNTVSARPDGNGFFDLFAVPIPLGKFVPRAQVMGGTEQAPIYLPFTIPAVKAKRLLAQWRHRIVFHNSGDKSVTPFRLVWGLLMSRESTA